MTARKPKVGGKRPGAGRKPSPDGPSVPRMIRLPASSAAAQDAAAAAAGKPWVDWARWRLDRAAAADDADAEQRRSGDAAAEARFVADHDPDALLSRR